MGWKEITAAVALIGLAAVAIWKEDQIVKGLAEATDIAAAKYTDIKEALAKREADAFRQELLRRKFERVTTVAA